MSGVLPLLRRHLYAALPQVVDEFLHSSRVTHGIVLTVEEEGRGIDRGAPKGTDASVEVVNGVPSEGAKVEQAHFSDQHLPLWKYSFPKSFSHNFQRSNNQAIVNLAFDSLYEPLVFQRVLGHMHQQLSKCEASNREGVDKQRAGDEPVTLEQLEQPLAVVEAPARPKELFDLTLHYEHVKASPEVDVTVLGDSLRTRAIPRQHEHQGSMLTGSVTWPAGGRARQVIRVEGDVVAEAVGSDAESQGCPAVHGRFKGLFRRA